MNSLTQDDDSRREFYGDVLIVGRKKIFLYEIAPLDTQEKHQGKQEQTAPLPQAQSIQFINRLNIQLATRSHSAHSSTTII